MKLEFRRVLPQARHFELEALNRLELAGLGSYYPGDVLMAAHLESELTRPNAAEDEGALTVFFRLIDQDGRENVEIVEQLYPEVFHYAGWIPPSADGRASVTITNEVAGGRFVLAAIVDGTEVKFRYVSGQYIADSQSIRAEKKAA